MRKAFSVLDSLSQRAQSCTNMYSTAFSVLRPLGDIDHRAHLVNQNVLSETHPHWRGNSPSGIERISFVILTYCHCVCMVHDNYRSITVHSSHFPLGKALNYCESLKYLDTKLLRHVTDDEKSAEKHALGKRAPVEVTSSTLQSKERVTVVFRDLLFPCSTHQGSVIFWSHSVLCDVYPLFIRTTY
uniref:Secreted protein n=1 Tax=Heterorhabditis bacteriophora TaxID=37862 RepID=A0A1I7W7T7_HETBA